MIPKLSNVERAKIREAFSQGVSRKELAYVFNVSYGHIGKILGRKKRKTVKK